MTPSLEDTRLRIWQAGTIFLCWTYDFGMGFGELGGESGDSKLLGAVLWLCGWCWVHMIPHGGIQMAWQEVWGEDATYNFGWKFAHLKRVSKVLCKWKILILKELRKSSMDFFFLGWDVAWQMLACKMLYKAVRGVCDLCYKEIISGLSGSVPIGGNFLNVTWMFLTQCCRSYQRAQERCFVGSRILVTNIPTRPVFLGSWVSGQLKSRDVASNQGSELSAAYKIEWRHCCAP